MNDVQTQYDDLASVLQEKDSEINQLKKLCAGKETKIIALSNAVSSKLAEIAQLMSEINQLIAPPPLTAGLLSDSAIASEFESTIKDWLPSAKKFELLYRGSRDGFNYAGSHSQLVGRSPTFFLVQTVNDAIFGGYAVCAWPSNGWITDDTLRSFLFSLRSPVLSNPQMFKLKDPQHCLYANTDHILYFGAGTEICIPNGCNTTTSSSSCVNPAYFENTTGNRFILCDTKNFMVSEVEIFRVFS